MSEEQKRLFLALFLSALVIFGWQHFFPSQNQFSPDPLQPSKLHSEDNKVSTRPVVSHQPSLEKKMGRKEKKDLSSFTLKSFTLKTEKSEVTLTNELSLVNFTRLNEKRDDFNSIVGPRNPFQVYIYDSERNLIPLHFELTQKDENKIEGSEPLYGIKYSGKINGDGVFSWKLTSPKAVQFYLKMESTKQEGEGRQIRQFVSLLKDTQRTNVDGEKEYEGNLQWMAIDYHYHLFANVLDNKMISSVKIKDGVFGVKLIESRKELSGYSFYGLKSYDDLQKMKNNLHLAVDFGVFGVIAVPILKGLQFFYRFAPNYGVAIILITLFIRGLLFPLQFKSFKSMKKMQKLQPELQKLKEKYSDDPQKMQKETMDLFKKNGANPMGGCLPLLLQMPVFFAFYQVLFNSVELLHAPFIFWIHDLSAKDPYYVLPILMGVAMFFQTKLNPSTTADPTQRKMMMFMPLIFTFFMKDLPAGLNLYILVSTIFGVAQQLLVYKTVD